MGMFDSMKDKLSGQDPDKMREGVEKGGDFVDDKTGNKYAEHVDKAQDAAHDQLGGNRDQAGGDPDRQGMQGLPNQEDLPGQPGQ